MAQLASADITLTAVSDACSVVLSPSSCSIHADYDGSNPILTYAYTDINVVRGDVKLAIDASNITINGTSNQGITTQLQTIDTYTQRLKITAIPSTVLSGNVEFTVTIGGFSISSTFPFNVVRESSMLDWIQDWETRKTQIGGEYIITPKIFAGQKNSTTGELTGVYIGPDTLGAGIYGYKEGETVFRINSNGAYIGGWNIETGGIMTADMKLQLLSEGTIKAIDLNDNNATIYELNKSGEASFAKGNVLFHADGSASFTGQITAASGSIGGWSIGQNSLHNDNIVIDSSAAGFYIINNAQHGATTASAYLDAIKYSGGMRMFYTSNINFGIDAWLSDTTETDDETGETIYHYRKAFSLGSDWSIAGWNFDHQRLYNANAVLVGANRYGGLFLSPDDISGIAVSGLTANIQAASGIYLGASSSFVELAGYSSGNLVFRLGTAGNRIGGWSFDNVKIWYGSTVTDNEGFMTNANSMIFGQGTIVGHKWRLSADGSGKLAAGKLYWDASGNTVFSGGTVKSDNNSTPAWLLNSDGSGHFASGKIAWDSNGLQLTGVLSLSANGCVQLTNAGICSEGNDNSAIRFWAGDTHTNRASARFRVTQYGSLYSTDAHITGEIEATSGKIGGFYISGSYIQNYKNSQYTSDAAIIFSDNNGIWAGFGTQAVSATTGLQIPMAVYNEQEDDFGLGTNYAAIFSAKNAYKNIALALYARNGNYSTSFPDVAQFNYAILGIGNCVLEGAVEGYSVSTDSISAANTVKETSFNDSNFKVVTSTQSDSGFILPTLSAIRTFLNISDTSKKFHLTVYYLVAESSSYAPKLYGRSSTSGSWMNDTKYPALYNTSGSSVANVQLSKTKPVMIELWWDGTNYRACAINA